MKKPFRWGILSTGSMSHTFAKALQAVPDAELAAVSSRTLEKAQEFAAQYQIPQSYGSYQEMISNPNLDIIYIASPMSAHFEQAKACLEAGKPVLCEKAVTLSAQELEELISLARERGLFFMEGMWLKCLPNFQKALEWREKIGKVTMASADFTCASVFQPDHRLFLRELGGGVTLDLGVYTLTLLLAFLGNTPSRITARGVIGCTHTDFQAAVLLDYDNGAFGVSRYGQMMDAHNSACIVGEKGRIIFEKRFIGMPHIKLYDQDGQFLEEQVVDYPDGPYVYEVQEVHRCLQAGQTESQLVPLAETLAVMKVLDECRRQIGVSYH